MIIGSDFDGVIAEDDFARIRNVKERFGIIVSPEDVHGKILEDKIGADAKKKFEFDLYSTEKTLEFQPTPGVADVFRKLIDDGHKVVIITYRDKPGVNWARKFLEIHNIPYHHMWSSSDLKVNAEREYLRWMAGPNLFMKGKGRLALIVKPVVFIDDNSKHLVEMEPLKEEITRFLFDKPYNRGVSIPGVTRVLGWDEIYEKIQELNAVLATRE